LPDEVVITDDGSTQDIPGYLKNIAKSLKFPVKYCEQNNQGFRVARCKNNGALIASGEILIFMDQDIIARRDYLELIKNTIKENVFVVNLPIRLSEDQTKKISFSLLENDDYELLLTKDQLRKVKKQFWKEKLYFILHRLHLRKSGLKLRGGAFALYKSNMFKVNGFDENYKGWGREDDDLGKRLNNSGIHGVNPFKDTFTLHQYHKPNHAGSSLNNVYYKDTKSKSRDGYSFCHFGLNNRKDQDKFRIIEI
jgi:glycosyltransferase involved in cell wall biosynthesis